MDKGTPIRHTSGHTGLTEGVKKLRLTSPVENPSTPKTPPDPKGRGKKKRSKVSKGVQSTLRKSLNLVDIKMIEEVMNELYTLKSLEKFGEIYTLCSEARPLFIGNTPYIQDFKAEITGLYPVFELILYEALNHYNEKISKLNKGTRPNINKPIPGGGGRSANAYFKDLMNIAKEYPCFDVPDREYSTFGEINLTRNVLSHMYGSFKAVTPEEARRIIDQMLCIIKCFYPITNDDILEIKKCRRCQYQYQYGLMDITDTEHGKETFRISLRVHEGEHMQMVEKKRKNEESHQVSNKKTKIHHYFRSKKDEEEKGKKDEEEKGKREKVEKGKKDEEEKGKNEGRKG